MVAFIAANAIKSKWRSQIRVGKKVVKGPARDSVKAAEHDADM